MSRRGVVVSAEGDRARVSAALRGLCGTCSQGGACHLHLSPATDRTDVITVRNLVGARPGETVELDFPGHAELRLSLLVWAVPLAGLVGGAMVGLLGGSRLGLGEDAGALAGAALGFAAAMFGLRTLDRRATEEGRLMPHVVRVLDPEECTTGGKG